MGQPPPLRTIQTANLIQRRLHTSLTLSQRPASSPTRPQRRAERVPAQRPESRQAPNPTVHLAPSQSSCCGRSAAFNASTMSAPGGADAPRDIRSFFTLRPQYHQPQQRPPPSQLPTQHHQMPRSRTPMKRSSPTGSSEEEDPLSGGSARTVSRPVVAARPPMSSTSRIAVMLPASPASKGHGPPPPRPVVSDLVRRPNAHSATVKKETPVPLPRIPNFPQPASVSAPPTSASTPVPGPASGGRGRPKGWKPGMSYSVMRGNGPPGSVGRPRQVKVKAGAPPLPPGMAKRRGRPPKTPSPPPDAVYRSLRPQFVEFLCEWAGCKAELHNLETLRRHVFAIHGRSEMCLWAKCAALEPPRTLTNGDEFRQHVEEAHLVPFAWHIGDGPQNREGGGCRGPVEKGRRGGSGSRDEYDNDDDNTSKARVPAFLLDADGNQVTPSVREQQTEDLATWRSNRRKLKELLIRRNDALPDEDSSDEPEDEDG